MIPFLTRRNPTIPPPQPAPRPILAIRVSREITSGTCGWWPPEVANYPGRSGTYVRLWAGRYIAEAVELPKGMWALCAMGHLDTDKGPLFETLADATDAFADYVLKEVKQYVAIEIVKGSDA